MKKVMIIGSGGAGKSTLARKLGDLLSIKVYHLDVLYWKPGWVETDQDEWEQTIADILDEPEWIMDGNYGGTMEMRARAVDTIIFLDYSTPRCLYGIFKRRIMYQGKSRPDMNEACPEKLDWEFIKWVAQYKRKKAPAIIESLNLFKEQGKTIHHFKTPVEAEAFIAGLYRKRH